MVFLVVLAILYKFAWGPISEGLQKRENEIAAQIAEAQRKNEEARQLLADYEKKLAAAQDEVRGLIEQGRRDAEKVGQQLVDKAREEAGIERQRAVQQIESATLAALKELADRSATLAVDLAGKIVGARLKAADHSRLIEQAVSEFSRSGQVKVNGKSHGLNTECQSVDIAKLTGHGMNPFYGSNEEFRLRRPMAESADIIARDAQNAARLSPDVGQEKVGEIYARALLGAAENAGQTVAVLEELDAIVSEVFAQFPKLETVLGSLLVSHEEKTVAAGSRLRRADFPAAAEFPQGRSRGTAASIACGRSGTRPENCTRRCRATSASA